MNIDDLTKEYLLNTFDFKNNSATDFVQEYFKIEAEIQEVYKNITSDNIKERNKRFYKK